MSVLEISQVVTAISVAVAAISIVVVARQAAPLLKRLDQLAREAGGTLQRLDRIAAEAEHVVHDARKLESRVAHTADWFLDRVEPPLRTVGALATAVSAGVGALWGPKANDGDGKADGHGR